MLSQLQGSLGKFEQQSYPPVDQWDPPFCGTIPLTIDAAGQWWYAGTLIKRAALIRLFSRVLKREGNDYFLVTPVEKVQIDVVDVPLLVVSWERLDNSEIVVHTHCADNTLINHEHPLEMRYNDLSQCTIPYIMIRNNLWAKVQQNVYYQLAAELVIEDEHAWLPSGEYRADFGPITESE